MAEEAGLRIPSTVMQRKRFAPVYSLLEHAVKQEVFPGCAFGALEWADDALQVAVVDGVGRQTYDPASPAIVASTIYDLASLTKVVATTAMAMLLYQRGVLDLDLPLVEVLPEFVCGQVQRSSVTIRQLLAHNSGLAGYARLFESCSTVEALFNACLCMPLEAMPGKRVEYSDIGFILLGRALERMAGETLDVFCAREVFNLLGMKRTLFRPPGTLKAEIPPSEDDQSFRHRAIHGEVQDENCFVLGGVSGHAGLFGGVSDLLRFAEAILSPPTTKLFHQKTVEVFTARVGEPDGSSRALGWDTPSNPSSSGNMFSAHSIGHLGYAGTSIWIDLEERCGVVLLSNRCWPSREKQKIKQLRPAFHDAVRKLLLSPVLTT